MEQETFKVVWHIQQWDHPLYQSAIEMRPYYMLRYALGEVTTPKVGYIFTFKSEEYARAFMEKGSSSMQRLLRCVGEVVESPYQRYICSYAQDIESFWTMWVHGDLKHVDPDLIHRGFVDTAPPGTEYCTWVRPIEVLKAKGD